MQAYFPGQRCISDTEAELGLGMVLEFDGRRVTIAFAAVEESRTYVADNAPLTRLRFLPGDKIQSGEGWWLTVEKVEEDGPLLIYYGHREDGSADILPEQRLSERVQFNQPRERLLAGQIEHNRWFNARAEAQHEYHRLKSSPLHGLTGVRGELLPHQLYVAQTVSNRESPRVLLADEVGLGKTIEAGMIMHRLLLNDRIKRVLVVVPEALQHQWLVEMLRRFNLTFSLFDAERLEAMREPEEHLSLEEALMDPNFSLDPPANPFSEQQLVLCGMDFLCDAETSDLALDAGWDMLIVDEAHHLAWSAEQASEQYQVVERLAAETASVLLLTATPEQLGNDSHFARLRLLDPDRYASLEQFQSDQANYQQVAESAAPLLHDAPLSTEQQKALAQWLDEEHQSLVSQANLNADERRRLISTLVDRTGTGRVLMRNTRAAVQGFAPRVLHTHPLEPVSGESADSWWRTDPRVKWLIDTLRSNYPRRYLLICSSTDTALDLAEALRVLAGIVPAVFHEGMSILDCDRAAAHFADPESGAPVLICSEIGSEGRNFQFVSDLILFDLPTAPGLLEQRIGRLDRIGQRNTVNIHVPSVAGSAEQRLCQWYHRGLDAFEQTCTVGEAVLEEFGDDLQLLMRENPDDSALESLIEKTAARATQLRAELETGRDKLLELNSYDETAANALRDQIVEREETTPWSFFERAADCFGLEIEQLSSSHYSVQVGSRSEQASFPGLGNDTIISVTCDRETALAREDVAFMSWEHP
ncbi:MAG: RNA polymerase-associated protein RapA, partial [Granulosicoccaceae bacterium]